MKIEKRTAASSDRRDETRCTYSYVRRFPILDSTLTNIADIGRESVHDVNKVRARCTKTNKEDRGRLVFLPDFALFSVDRLQCRGKYIPRHGLSIFSREDVSVLVLPATVTCGTLHAE